MTFMPLGVVAALLLVLATRGSLARLGRLPLRALDMLFAGLALQVLLQVVHIPQARVDDVGFGLLLASYALILTFCLGNLHVRGMTIVLLGVALNAVVIALNQGMPANGPTRRTADGHRISRVITNVKHRPERPDDLLTPLDDRIMLPRPSHDLLSFGDLVLVAGLLDVCYWGSRRDEEDGSTSVFAMSFRAGGAPAPKAARPPETVQRDAVKIEDSEDRPAPEGVEDNTAFLAYDSILDLSKAERAEREGQAGTDDRRDTTRSSAATTSWS